MAGRFTKRRVARAAAEVEKKAFSESLYSWWSERMALRKKATKKRVSRGVDRVPAHLRGLGRSLEYVVEHTDNSHSWRRRQHLNTGRSMATSTNAPYVNPRRDAKSAKAGRLRKELQP